MAKAKKIESSDETKVATNSSESKKDKPAKKLTKVSKPRVSRAQPQHPKFSEMVTAALAEDNNHKGHTLSAIRNFIAKTYNLKMTKQRQNIIKQLLKAEFEDGRIIMADHEGEEILFTKRFKLVSGKQSKSE